MNKFLKILACVLLSILLVIGGLYLISLMSTHFIEGMLFFILVGGFSWLSYNIWDSL